MYALFATTNMLYLGICDQPKLAYPINGCTFMSGHSLIPYSMFGFIYHEWEHGHEIQTSVKATALCRIPQTGPPWDWAYQPASTHPCMCGTCVLPHHC